MKTSICWQHRNVFSLDLLLKSKFNMVYEQRGNERVWFAYSTILKLMATIEKNSLNDRTILC